MSEGTSMGHRAITIAGGFLLALSMAATAGADTVLYARGTSGAVPPVESLLAGAYLGDEVVAVDYPASAGPFSGLGDPTFGQSVEIGAAAIDTQARAVSGPLVVVGYSLGAMAVQHAATALNDDPSIPSGTTFVEVANPNLGLFAGHYGRYLPGFDYVPRLNSETRFNMVVVTHEYDAWADPVIPSGNLLAGVNAVMAMAYFHPVAHYTDLSAVPPQNITRSVNSQGGTTTTYLVPAVHLPLTLPLRHAGVPDEVVDRVDAVLRPVIDSGYARHRPPAIGKADAGTPRTAAARVASADRAAAGASRRARS